MTIKKILLSLLLLIPFFLPMSTLAYYEAVIDFPLIYELPDQNYPNATAITWQGGEEKFGKWRNFFNGYEMGWGISYNTKWNYKDNTWDQRDSIDSRANICSMIRFNVAEGNVGGNVFEINFAAGSDFYTPPDWNSAASYFFYDGNSETQAPAMFRIKSPGNVDATIQLAPDEGENPNRINLRNACDGKFYIEYEKCGSAGYYDSKYTAERTSMMEFSRNTIDAYNGFTFRTAGTVQDKINNSATLYVDKDTGNIMLRIQHNGEIREGIIINFEDFGVSVN